MHTTTLTFPYKDTCPHTHLHTHTYKHTQYTYYASMHTYANIYKFTTPPYTFIEKNVFILNYFILRWKGQIAIIL